MRRLPVLSSHDRWRIVLLGLIGYYLSSYLDFIGLRYISAGLERLILFLTPSFVLLMSVFLLKNASAGLNGWPLPFVMAALYWYFCMTPEIAAQMCG